MKTAEFQLAIDAIRWSFKDGDTGSVDWSASGIDWRKLQALAKRHRVEALIWKALEKLQLPVPAEVADKLAKSTARTVGHNLRVATESATLLAKFRQQGIAPLFVKGLTLGALTYRNPFLKMGWDIDLLVPLNRIADASRILEDAGYLPVVPSCNPSVETLAAWHVGHKESLWQNAGGQLHLDLHSRLSDNKNLIPNIDAEAPRQDVEVASGIVLPTLANDELYSYLCVHGSSSAWFRLKWVADFAALISGHDISEINRLHGLAGRNGAGRASAQALLLAHELFAVNLGDELKAELQSEIANRWLATIGRMHLTGWLASREPTETPLGTAFIHASQLLLAPGWRFKMSEVRRQLTDVFQR